MDILSFRNFPSLYTWFECTIFLVKLSKLILFHCSLTGSSTNILILFLVTPDSNLVDGSKHELYWRYFEFCGKDFLGHICSIHLQLHLLISTTVKFPSQVSRSTSSLLKLNFTALTIWEETLLYIFQIVHLRLSIQHNNWF